MKEEMKKALDAWWPMGAGWFVGNLIGGFLKTEPNFILSFITSVLIFFLGWLVFYIIFSFQRK